MISTRTAIALDFPEEVSLGIDPNVYSTAVLAGETITLNYHPIEQAILQLREQYAVGTLQVKVYEVDD